MEWISVKDRLPEDGDYSVFVWLSNDGMDMVHVQDWIRDGIYFQDDFKVTHWMIPDPPEGE